MATVQELVEALIARFPEDAEELQSALQVLQRQRIGSCDRLGRLSDSQWQRLDLPIGIEALLRDEAAQLALPAAAPAAAAAGSPGGGGAPGRGGAGLLTAATTPAPVAAAPQAPPPASWPAQHAAAADSGELPLEPLEPPEGLHRRCSSGYGASGPMPPRRGGDGNVGASGATRAGKNNFSAPVELTPPPDLDELWQQLLEDTLPPDKRKLLQETWESTPNSHDRYMMYLEYTSYLRKPEISEEEKEDRRKQIEPLLREFGLGTEEESLCPTAFVWSMSFALLFFVVAVIYYACTQPEPVHDLQSL